MHDLNSLQCVRFCRKRTANNVNSGSFFLLWMPHLIAHSRANIVKLRAQSGRRHAVTDNKKHKCSSPELLTKAVATKTELEVIVGSFHQRWSVQSLSLFLVSSHYASVIDRLCFAVSLAFGWDQPPFSCLIQGPRVSRTFNLKHCRQKNI